MDDGETRNAGVPRTDTRARILAISAALFHERGYAGTSMRDISERLGTTKAALYYHFLSKEDILEALVSPALDALDQLIANAEAAVQIDPGTLLTDLVRSTAAVSGGIGPIDLPSVVREQDERFSVAARLDRIATLLAGTPDGEALIRAHAALGAMTSGMTAAARGYRIITDPQALHERFERDLSIVVASSLAALRGAP